MRLFNHSDFVVLRTPFYHFNTDKADLRDLINDQTFIEAIYLSSPSLYNEIVKYTNSVIDIEETKKLEISLERYHLRMRYRCTPFGLFSGVSLCKIQNRSSLKLVGSVAYLKNTRLDTHFLSSWTQNLIKDTGVMEDILWYPNNTIYRTCEKLRYVEQKIDNETRSYHLSNVDDSIFIQNILSKAKNGASVDSLASSIINKEITKEEAIDFVHEMIGCSLLISELEAEVTGAEYHDQLILKLRKYSSCNKYAKQLSDVVSNLNAIDSDGPGVSINRYLEVTRMVESWNTQIDRGKLLQSDLIKPMLSNELSQVIFEELENAIELLAYTNKNSSRNGNLENFKESFLRRYERNEVSLIEVLDTEMGIGYPANENSQSDKTPLLNGILIDNENQQLNSFTIGKWQTFLLNKYKDCIQKDQIIMELSSADFDSNLGRSPSSELNFPESFYTLCCILSSSEEDLDNGNFQIIHEITDGPSAANLLGRFCHADKNHSDFAKKLIATEQNSNPDVIYAEITHIAQSRLGNILMRPILRQYEIPIITRSSVPLANTINIEDLLVSIKEDRIFLYSQTLEKEVIPRLTSAHNFSFNSIPHYHFLCDLQSQNTIGHLSWQWGVLKQFSFLPRVTFGKVILSKATWVIDFKNFDLPNKATEDQVIGALEKYLKANKVPNAVTISQGDNQLPLNLTIFEHRRILAQDLIRNKIISLEECIFNKDNLFVRDEVGKFTNEFIIPWQKINANKVNHSSFANTRSSVGRMFPPGTSWHFIKIYCGVKTTDKLLAEVIRPLTQELLNQAVIDKWFFIRYADPDHHIRIRFSGTGTFYTEVTERLNKVLSIYLDNQLVWKIQSDTYNRELERYGAENIENSESFFFYDSQATVQILSMLEGDEGDDLRWQFAIKGVNDLLNSFGIELQAKQELMSIISTSFLKEFNADNTVGRKQINSKYREIKASIHLALQDRLDASHEFYPVWEIFSQRNKNIAPCIRHINNLSEQNKLTVNKSELIASYIHMFLNRFLRSKQRLQEMVIYDLLRQHYRSLLARESKEVLSSLK